MKKKYRVYIAILEKYRTEYHEGSVIRHGTTVHYLACRKWFRTKLVDRHRDWDLNMSVVADWVERYKVKKIFISYKVPKFLK